MTETKICDARSYADKGNAPKTATKQIVNDDQIEAAFKGTNFGHTEHRKLLEASVLKRLLGYHCGHTITVIMRDMKLIGKSGKITKKGMALVKEAFSGVLDNLMTVGG